eukprot:scaffold247588_cov30-Tisochrysis_lutea.AAC.1
MSPPSLGRSLRAGCAWVAPCGVLVRGRGALGAFRCIRIRVAVARKPLPSSCSSLCSPSGRRG